MHKFLLSCLIVSCFFIFSVSSFAVVVDLSDYGLADLDTGSDTIYSNQILISGNIFVFSSAPLTADGSNLNCPADCFVTYYSYSSGSQTWRLEEEATNDYSNDTIASFNSIVYSNYTVYATDDPSDVIYQPTEEGGENMAQVLADLTTVMTSVLTNATSLVTWITNNPLVYLWIILAIILVIISFVKGFIRGV